MKSKWTLFTALVAFALCGGACSDKNDDGDDVKKDILSSVKVAAQSVTVPDDGVFQVTFSVEPATAKITSAELKPSNLAAAGNYTMTQLKAAEGGAGNWTASFKTKDMGLVAVGSAVSLYVGTEINQVNSAVFALADPKFLNIRSFYFNQLKYQTWMDAETGQVLACHMAVAAAEPAEGAQAFDMSRIVRVEVEYDKDMLTLQQDAAHPLRVAFVPVKEKFAAVMPKNGVVYSGFASFTLYDAYGRHCTHPTVRVRFFAPDAVNAAPLVVSEASLADDSFEKEYSFDYTDVLAEVGYTSDFKKENRYYGINSVGLRLEDKEGNSIDNRWFIHFFREADGKTGCDITVLGDSENPLGAGTYYLVTRFFLDEDVDQAIYPVLRALVRQKIEVTE